MARGCAAAAGHVQDTALLVRDHREQLADQIVARLRLILGVRGPVAVIHVVAVAVVLRHQRVPASVVEVEDPLPAVRHVFTPSAVAAPAPCGTGFTRKLPHWLRRLKRACGLFGWVRWARSHGLRPWTIHLPDIGVILAAQLAAAGEQLVPV